MRTTSLKTGAAASAKSISKVEEPPSDHYESTLSPEWDLKGFNMRDLPAKLCSRRCAWSPSIPPMTVRSVPRGGMVCMQ